MADSLVQHGIVRAIADDNGDFVDSWMQVEVTGGTATWTVNDQSPGNPAVLTIDPGGGGGLATLAVTDINDPSAELNARAGGADGEVVLVYQLDANGTALLATTLYVYQADQETEASPFIIDADTTGSWIAQGPTYHAGTAKSLAFVAGEVVGAPDETTDTFALLTGVSFPRLVLAKSGGWSELDENHLAFNIDSTGSVATFKDPSNDTVFFSYSDGTYTGSAQVPAAFTDDRVWTVPDASGEIALVAYRAATIDSDDYPTVQDRTIGLSTSAFGIHSVVLFDPAGYPGYRLTCILTNAYSGGAYHIVDHNSTVMDTMSAAGQVITVITDGTDWYLESKNF